MTADCTNGEWLALTDYSTTNMCSPHYMLSIDYDTVYIDYPSYDTMVNNGLTFCRRRVPVTLLDANDNIID